MLAGRTVCVADQAVRILLTCKGKEFVVISHAMLASAFNMIQKQTKIRSVHGNKGVMLPFAFYSFSISCSVARV